MKNLLILSAGRRVELLNAFVVEMKQRLPSAKVFAADSAPYFSAACHLAEKSFKLPNVVEHNYIRELLALSLEQKISLIVPTIDSELNILAVNRDLFLDNGIHVVISDPSLVRRCRDKRLTASLFSELNINTPKIFSKSEIKFPCFVKPYDGSMSKETAYLATKESISEKLLSNSKLIFMEFVDLSHKEYTVDLYYNKSGELKCLVPRIRLEVRGGEISKGITKKGKVYDFLIKRLGLLPGARGCLTLQLFVSEDTERFYGLEINPRFGGGYPLSYDSGANFPQMIIDEYLLGREVKWFDDWEDNLMMLRYDSRVLIHDKN